MLWAEAGCYHCKSWGCSARDTGHSETRHHQPRACGSLRIFRNVCSLGWGWLPVRNSYGKRLGWCIRWVREFLGNQQNRDNSQVNEDSDLVAACTSRLCGKGTLHRTNGSFHSSPYPEATQFSSSLYFSVVFWAAIPLLELKVSFCELVSLCAGPWRGHLGFQQPSISSG